MWPPVTWTSVCGLLSLLLSVAQPVASAQCPSDWANYSRRNSCFKIYSTLESLYWATQNCKKKLGGPQNNTEGYLARIFDQQTDEFLKQLLQESGLDAVWIGLEDRGKDGLYKWNDYRELGKGDYVGWKDGEDHQSDGIYSGVTLRKDGWTELYYTNRLAYLCQVPAGLPDVEMTCPPTTEDGHPADITCTFKQAPWTSLTWIVNDQYKKATCYPDFGCKPLSGFQANVDNSSGIVKSKFTILKADFERHSRVTCSVQFKTGSLRQSASCDLPVYSKPDAPTCIYNFTDTGVHVRCEVDKVYPSADCVWARLPVKKLTNSSSSISNIIGSRYKKMSCNLWDDLTATGNNTYKYTVKAIPQVHGVTDVESVTSVPTDVIVSVYPPSEAPEIYITRPDQPGEKIQDLSIPVRVTAGHTTTLTCLVKGGSPHVHETTIKCGNEVRAVQTGNAHRSADTSRVTMTFNNTNAVDKNYCECSAKHIAEYDKESRITFAVDVPAHVERFYISKHFGKVTVPEGTAAFMCKTAGSPWANITLYKENKPLKTSIGKTRSTASLYHPVQLTCEDSGRYQCHAENGVVPQNVTTQWKTLDVNVTCKPRTCDDVETVEGFGSLDNDAIISVCVTAYPEPYDIRLSRDEKAVPWQRYDTGFSYTKQPRGVVTITLKNVTEQDFNDPYKLFMKNSVGYSYSNVKLSPRGPPQCPRSLEVGEVSSNYVTLQWRAGSDGGQEQTFFVLRHSGLNNDSRVSGRQKVAASDVTQNSRQAVNITALRQKTDYFFSVTASNGFGSAQNCEIINVSTIAAFGAEALSDSEDSTPTVIVVVVVIVILIAIVVAAVVVIFLRRRMRKDKTVEPKPQPHKRGSNVVIINNELYATSKDVVGAKGGSTAAHTGPEPGTYANHGALQVPDVVYANTPRHPAKVKADVPEENLYANSSQVTNKRGSQSIPAVNSDPNKGRSVSKDGLIYVTVDINPMTSKPEMSRGVAQEESKHDQVDYASLDLLSMSVKNAELKKEGGASGKD